MTVVKMIQEQQRKLDRRDCFCQELSDLESATASELVSVDAVINQSINHVTLLLHRRRFLNFLSLRAH